MTSKASEAKCFFVHPDMTLKDFARESDVQMSKLIGIPVLQSSLLDVTQIAEVSVDWDVRESHDRGPSELTPIYDCIPASLRMAIVARASMPGYVFTSPACDDYTRLSPETRRRILKGRIRAWKSEQKKARRLAIKAENARRRSRR